MRESDLKILIPMLLEQNAQGCMSLLHVFPARDREFQGLRPWGILPCVHVGRGLSLLPSHGERPCHLPPTDIMSPQAASWT